MEDGSGDDHVEVSFAVEYAGSPLSFTIRTVNPVDIHRIPVADQVLSAYPPTSIPVVQPLHLHPKRCKEKKKDESSPASTFDCDDDIDDQTTDDSGQSRCPVAIFEDDGGNDDNLFSEKAKISESEEEEEQRPAVVAAKRGSCHRCGRGNLFSEKEVCLVCGAKYCFRCVLPAMGSMPEGRKCLSCVGRPVPESMRGRLGRSSRMMKRMLSTRELQQLMSTERCCEANKLRPEHVVVNGRHLSAKEMGLLQSCSNPPSRLAPGRYWYDYSSGLWGKEGNKPGSFISPHLNIGGRLMQEASNGNTGVFINRREITKTELKLLKYAGVHYAGGLNFWLYADGTYLEEGSKKTRGNLWSKPGTKLYCSILSLPVPSKWTCNSQEELRNMSCTEVPVYDEQKAARKLLLVGSHGSGTSTIFKQVRLLYGKSFPFSEKELEDIKIQIQKNVFRYLGILLEGRRHFEEAWLSCHQRTEQGNDFNITDQQNIYSISPRLKKFSDWFIGLMDNGNLEDIFLAATHEYAPTVEEFWKSPAIQATYQRRSELQPLPCATSYFLEQFVSLSRPEYKTTDMDIILCEGITSSNGLACTEFSLACVNHGSTATDDCDEHECPLRYQLIRVHAKGQGENRKWLEMFEDVRLVIFCAALTDYSEYCEDANGIATNKMLATRELFASIATHPTFDGVGLLLALNKFDLLEETIQRTPLTVCDWFGDFNPAKSRRLSRATDSPALEAFHYIAVKFKRLYASLTGRKLYAAATNAMDARSIDEVLRYASVIVDWGEGKLLSHNEFTSRGTESSS